MMKKFRILLLFLCCLSFIGLSVNIVWAADSEDFVFTYRQDGDTIAIESYYGDGNEIKVPNSIDGHKVAEIDSHAFENCPNLKSVTIPSSVTQIGDNLFPSDTDVSMKGETGSQAESYCEKYNLDFIPIDSGSVISSGTSKEINLSKYSFYKDVTVGQWYTPSIYQLTKEGVIHGYGDGYFLPEKSVTRAEFVQMLANLSHDTISSDNVVTPFKDVNPTAWYAPVIQWAYEHDIVHGMSETIFAPERNISRQELATMLDNYRNMVDKITLPVLVEKRVFNDDSQIGDWAKDKVYSLQLAGIIDGRENGMFAPTASATRAEVSKMLDYYLQLIKTGTVEKTIVETGTYGTSGRGRNLTYTSIYRPGYQHTAIFVFEQHGFEDSYNRDGQVLVDLAKETISFLNSNIDRLWDCRVIIISSANPDGLAEGTTKNGPGRCTVANRTDMNRDWPTSNYEPQTSNPRYYSPYALSCPETRNLKQLISRENPSVLLDIHGWLNGSYGNQTLAYIFKENMGLPYKVLFSSSAGLSANNVTYLPQQEKEMAFESGLVGFKGYLAGYGKEQGMYSALIELPSPYNINKSGFFKAIENSIYLCSQS